MDLSHVTDCYLKEEIRIEICFWVDFPGVPKKVLFRSIHFIMQGVREMFVKPGEHYIADVTFLYHKTQYKSMNVIEFCVLQDFNKYFWTPYGT